MKYAYFPGCKIPRHLPEYDRTTRAVLDRLGVRLAEVRFNCCGYPIRQQSFEASVFSAARNLALARRDHLTLLTPCKCCYGNLKHAEYWLKQRPNLRIAVNDRLAREGLHWDDDIRVIHLLTLLDEDLGEGMIRERVVKPLTGLRVAAHYGCHALRPSEVTQFDNPLAPTIFERLLAAAGATPVDWPLRLECCGNPLQGKNDRLSLNLMTRKLQDARHAGADVVATACTYCQMQFDRVKSEAVFQGQGRDYPPAVLVSVLLGVSMGLNFEMPDRCRV
jgi:heterodisulfide reductase subunit B